MNFNPKYNSNFLIVRNGYEFWSELYPECAGSRQSPINIDTSLVNHREDIPRLHLHHYSQVTEANTLLINNGRTLELHIKFSGKQPTLFGGRLRDKFTLVGAHFHWGATSCMGSEHTINRHRFVLSSPSTKELIQNELGLTI